MYVCTVISLISFQAFEFYGMYLLTIFPGKRGVFELLAELFQNWIHNDTVHTIHVHYIHIYITSYYN